MNKRKTNDELDFDRLTRYISNPFIKELVEKNQGCSCSVIMSDGTRREIKGCRESYRKGSLEVFSIAESFLEFYANHRPIGFRRLLQEIFLKKLSGMSKEFDSAVNYSFFLGIRDEIKTFWRVLDST